jgi:hypothetical protein
MATAHVSKVRDAFALVKRSRDLGTDSALEELELKRSKPPEFAETLRKLDFSMRSDSEIKERVVLYRRALSYLTSRDDAILRARLQSNLAGYLLMPELRDLDRNVEDAIDLSLHAAKVFTKEKYPERWANLQYNLAHAFGGRETDGLVRNLETSLKYFNQALEVYTQQDYPERYSAMIRGRAMIEEMLEDAKADKGLGP